MAFGSTIVEFVAPRLAPLGFTYQENPSAGSWRFARPEGEVTQYVTFVRHHRTPRTISVHFGTSHSPIHWPAHALAPEARAWWTYEDEASLQAVLAELLGLVTEQGIPWLQAQQAERPCMPAAVAYVPPESQGMFFV